MYTDANTPTDFCEDLTEKYLSISDASYRKKHGQYFTPKKIALFMSDMLTNHFPKNIKLLDPGAGVGILSCAFCERISKEKQIETIQIDAYELDNKLRYYLRQAYEYTKEYLLEKNIQLEYHIHKTDFILSTAHTLKKNNNSKYDLEIINPPYFKIAKDDERAKLNSEFVHGQPNIYFLFMAVSAKLLNESGQFVSITPRSFTSGQYFRQFRKEFFKLVQPEHVHVFESRKDAFKNQSVLQENIILKGRKDSKNQKVKISVSNGGGDLTHFSEQFVPLNRILIKVNNKDILFRLPQNKDDLHILDIVDGWESNLTSLGLNISTGPVVPFRATEFLKETNVGAESLVPLLWMENIKPMEIMWPYQNNGKKKPKLIINNAQTRKKKLLVKNSNYVLLRRFGPKEQKKRLVAAPLFKDDMESSYYGFENHVNYIYRINGELSIIESLGLSALLNSSIVDKYFRISNGNTEVGATEIKNLSLPSIRHINAIGEKIHHKKNVSDEEIDSIVLNAIESKTNT